VGEQREPAWWTGREIEPGRQRGVLAAGELDALDTWRHDLQYRPPVGGGPRGTSTHSIDGLIRPLIRPPDPTADPTA
jgi:hypothetical protein